MSQIYINKKNQQKEKLLQKIYTNINTLPIFFQKNYVYIIDSINHKVQDKSNKSYSHIDIDERKFIELCFHCNASVRSIANYLDRSPNTISYEINKNSVYITNTKRMEYRFRRAQQKAEHRKSRSIQNADKFFEGFIKFVKETRTNKRLWSLYHLHEKFLQLYPDATVPCLATLYNWLKLRRPPVDLSYFRYKKQRKPIGKTYYTGEKKSISERPIDLNDYVTPGHYEIDTVFNEDLKGGALTLNHRATMKFYSIQIPDRKASTIILALRRLIKINNLKILTITSDNGSEFANWQIAEKEFDLKWYFARPYRSGDRGQNERLNRDLRIFYPKGTNFHNISPCDFDKTIVEINDFPRKKFNGLSSTKKEQLLSA